MNIINKTIVLALGVLALSSCVREDDNQMSENKGTAVFKVDLKNPQSRALSEVSNFPVNVYNEAGAKVLSYNSVAEIPAQVVMEVGTYNVEAHTPGVIEKNMDAPYYKGVEEMEILKGITSQVDVICKMQNSKIVVNYDDEFVDLFATWDVTIDDGSDTALSFSETSASNFTYWYFGEQGAKELTVNFKGVTKEGNTLTTRSVLTKTQASESYDDDNENFCGGDIITINFAPSEETEGKVTDITITANVSFDETEESVTVEVVDVPGLKGDGGEGGEGGDEGDQNNIVLNLPKNMTVAADTDPSKGDAFINCPDGIKSIMVKVSSTSADMISSLSDLNDGYGVDFVNGAEVVGNTTMVNLFTELGQTLAVPAEGDTEYTFPIGNFFGLLIVLPGQHTFDLVVTDMNGKTKSGKLTLTVN